MKTRTDDDIFDMYANQADMSDLAAQTVTQIAADLMEIDNSLNPETAYHYAEIIHRMAVEKINQ